MDMLLENRLVRDLPEKASIEIDDYIIVEDLDGTKLGAASGLRKLIMNNLVFDNIKEMKMSKLNDGDYCMTLGYHSAGDGGSAVYKIVYEPTAVDDKAYYHYLYTSDTSRARYIPFNGIVTPEQFGAYGDGSRDDSNAIIKALESNCKVIFGNNKVYKITKSIELYNKYNIDLNGCTIKPVNCSAFSISISNTNEVFNDIYIRNGKIDMSLAASANAINIQKVTENLTIENIVVENTGKIAINACSVKKLKISNCILKSKSIVSPAIKINKATGGSIDSVFADISNISFYNFAAAVQLEGLDPTTTVDVNIYNCLADNESSTNTTYAYFLRNSLPASAESKGRRYITLNSIKTNRVTSLIENQYSSDIDIKNIYMKSANYLATSIDINSTLLVEGIINVNGSGPYSGGRKNGVFNRYDGSVYINTPNIMHDDNFYDKLSTPSLYNGCTLYDMVPISSRSLSDIITVTSSNHIEIYNFRNFVANVNNCTGAISIGEGINNQMIVLTRTEGTLQITNGSGNITLNDNSFILSKNNSLYLKYNSTIKKWVQTSIM